MYAYSMALQLPRGLSQARALLIRVLLERCVMKTMLKAVFL